MSSADVQATWLARAACSHQRLHQSRVAFYEDAQAHRRNLLGCREAGLSERAIAEALGVSHSVVGRAIRRVSEGAA